LLKKILVLNYSYTRDISIINFIILKGVKKPS